ncbi:MAG: DUF3078 domain-containing protein [Prevotellaceae bacterium]|jgi:hypothetical protein|nr:DUF3078 domain-containing protein [Prevotellaceae bacterium]
MRILITVSAVMTLFLATVSAQEKKEEAKKASNWKINGVNSFNLTQSSFSNWAAGGENTISGLLSGNLHLNLKKEKTYWENYLNYGYGLSYQSGKRSKTNDKIEYGSKFGYKAFGNMNYSASFTFSTQMDKGYPKYPAEKGDPYNSKFMSPAYSTLSVGFDYKPRNDFSIELSPIGGKLTFVRDDSLSKVGVFGVKPGKHSYYEFGASLKASCKNFKIVKNITLNSNLSFFSNLLHNPENIDVNWTVAFNFQITKFISSNLNMDLIYDDDIKNSKTGGPIIQFKQILGIGFSYNF